MLKIAPVALLLVAALVGCNKEEPVSTQTGTVSAPATQSSTAKGGPGVGGIGVADAQVNPNLQNPDSRIGSQVGSR